MHATMTTTSRTITPADNPPTGATGEAIGPVELPIVNQRSTERLFAKTRSHRLRRLDQLMVPRHKALFVRGFTDVDVSHLLVLHDD